MRGWWWRAYLAFWSAALLLVAMGIGLYLRNDVFLVPGSDAWLGFMTRDPDTTGKPDGGAMVFSREAFASGLRAGDRIVALGDISAAGEGLPVLAAMKRLGEPGCGVVETVSPDGMRAAYRLSNSLAHVDEPFAGSVAHYRTWRVARLALERVGDTLAAVVLGCLLVKRPRDPLAPWRRWRSC